MYPARNNHLTNQSIKTILLFLTILVLFVFSCINVGYAEPSSHNKYDIIGNNGVVTIGWDSVAWQGSDQCWEYARLIYEKIWGHKFSKYFNDSENMLRNLSDDERKISLDNTKNFISQAPLGSSIRIASARKDSDSSFDHDGVGQTLSTGKVKYGHNIIIVAKSANGFTYIENISSGRNEQTVTWEQFVSKYASKYLYFKYIKFPNAPTYTSNPYAQFTPTGTFSNVYYRVIKGAGNLYEYPYSDSSPKDQVNTNIEISSLTAKDVVEVVETVNNSLGNSWAKLRNGYFISMDNLEFLYSKEESVNLTATSTQKDLQTLPFADAIVGSTMSGSSMQVNLVEKYKNKYNNIWYKISSDQGGYFINVNNLSNITNNVTLTLRSGSTWPGNKNSSGSYPTGYPKGELEKGKIFGLRGIIDSNENISKVIATITNLSTGSKTSEDDTPNAKSFNFNGSSINDNLKFNEL